MAKQVVGLFDNMQDAQGAVQALRDAGFTADNISVVANNASGDATSYETSGDGGTRAAEDAGFGMASGAVMGGLGGLLVGLGALAIPGVGPVIAAGSLATALGTTAVGAGLGAAAGGLVGALVGAGIPEEDAHVYAEGVRRGGALVTVTADADEDADRAADILDSYNVVDIDERSGSYREAGWSRFDENAGPYSSSTGGTGTTAGSYGGRGDSADNNWEESSKVGTAGGTLAGAATGAAIGSVGGPVGTVVGGVAGAVTGAGVGAAGDAAGEAAEDSVQGEDDFGRSRAVNTGGGMGGVSGTGLGADMGSVTGTAGTTGSTGTSGSYTQGSMQTGSRDIGTTEGEVAIPVVEEEIRVGKREVESGGVRVNVNVEETPVQEQVTLREERVEVERRPVDRPVDASTVSGAFQEGTFEVRERDEQAVVQKEARVVEEVVINKDVEQRTETIQDTVRRTDVDVQQVPGQTRTSGYVETGSTGTTGMSGTTGSSTMGGTTGGTTGGSQDEGMIERGLSKAENAAERATGLDLDRDRDVGQRDPRNNF